METDDMTGLAASVPNAGRKRSIHEEKEIKIDSGTNIPLFVSVRGHSDITENSAERVKEEVTKIFEELESFKNTRIYLLTSLKMGSEMIATKIAMEKGLGIAPVLPMERDRYKQTSKEKPGFKEYCKDFDMILNSPGTLSPVLIETPKGKDGRDSHRNMSTFIIKNSHIMIAAWDGLPYSHDGGTFDTVRMANNGIDVSLRKSYRRDIQTRNDAEIQINYLDTAEDCLMYWIKVDRNIGEDALREKGWTGVRPPEGSEGGYIVPKTMRNVDSDGEPEWYDSGELSLGVYKEMPPSYKSMIERLDEMNSDIFTGIHGDNPIATDRETVFDNIFERRDDREECANDIVDRMEKDGSFVPISRRYHLADMLARDYQSRSFKGIKRLALLTVLNTAFFSLFILLNDSLLFNALYIVTTLALILLSGRHRGSRVYMKFMEYRCVAEAMRVEVFRAIIGLSDQTQLPSYGYMKNDFVWIRFVLKSWCSEFMNDYDKDTASMGTLKDRV